VQDGQQLPVFLSATLQQCKAGKGELLHSKEGWSVIIDCRHPDDLKANFYIYVLLLRLPLLFCFSKELVLADRLTSHRRQYQPSISYPIRISKHPWNGCDLWKD
jgi:hypothetical protein